MNIWKLISGVALVFIIGVLIGSIGTRIYFKHRHPPRSLEPKAKAAFIMNKLSRELNLTQEQKNATEKIVEQMMENLHQHSLKSRSGVQTIVDEDFSRVKAGLSDDQKKKLDVMREKFDKRRRERRDGL
jgi:hypothetical protein